MRINNKSRKLPIYQYLWVRGFVRIPSRTLLISPETFKGFWRFLLPEVELDKFVAISFAYYE